MTPILDTDSGAVFIGSVEGDESLAEAAEIAQGCAAFSRDDDDECYVDGDEPSCFNCRSRRWIRDGFSCTRRLLRG